MGGRFVADLQNSSNLTFPLLLQGEINMSEITMRWQLFSFTLKGPLFGSHGDAGPSVQGDAGRRGGAGGTDGGTDGWTDVFGRRLTSKQLPLPSLTLLSDGCLH